LDFSKIEAGKMTFEKVEFDLQEAAKSAVNLLVPRAKEKKLSLDYSLAPGVGTRVIGDPSRLRQILLNLLGNAVKFTEKGNVIMEITQLGETEDQIHLRFSIRDTGIGISEKNLNNLFQSFSQADASMNRKFGGTGLGLAICRRLAELMDGNIGVDSVLGKGSTFWFTLKLAKQKGAGPATAPATAPEFVGVDSDDALKGIQILFAEDNPVNQTVGARQLKKIGCDVDVVANGLDAVALWREKKHRIVLLDCQMPEMDGYEAAQKIREIEREQQLPGTYIIALTACAMDGDRELCLAAGMDYYISKPVKEGELKAALGRGLAKSQKTPSAVNPQEKPKESFPA
jgi:two-component system, sensor histidine kinase and response regulator